VTTAHYAKPESVAGARTHQFEERLGVRNYRDGSAGDRGVAKSCKSLNLCGREDLNFHTVAGTRT
jgi:hypothetical protein